MASLSAAVLDNDLLRLFPVVCDFNLTENARSKKQMAFLPASFNMQLIYILKIYNKKIPVTKSADSYGEIQHEMALIINLELATEYNPNW